MQPKLAYLYLAMHGHISGDWDSHTEIAVRRQDDGTLSWGANCFMPWEIYFLPDYESWVLDPYDEKGNVREDLQEGDFGDLPLVMANKLGQSESDAIESDLLALHLEQWDSSYGSGSMDFDWELYVELDDGEEPHTSFRRTGELVPADMKRLLEVLARLEPAMDDYVREIEEDTEGRVLADNRMPEEPETEDELRRPDAFKAIAKDIAARDRQWNEEHRDGVFRVIC